MSGIKLTIIIPHYNYPNGLSKLLKTIPNKEEIQVIVIDDKSNKDVDKLLQIREEFSKKNVEFYDNILEKGAGNCRNIGLSKARGEWLLFADSDDTFIDGFYDTVMEFFDKEYDLVMFVPTSVYAETGEKAKRHKLHSELYNEYLKKPTRRNLLRAVHKPVTPWSKLIRTSIVKDNNIVFGNTKVANDVLFSAKVAVATDKYYISDKEIYCVTDREKSLTTKYDEATLDIRRGVFIEHVNIVRNHLSPKEYNYLEYNGFRYYVFTIKYGFGIKKFKELNKEFKREHIKIICVSELWHMFISRLVGR